MRTLDQVTASRPIGCRARATWRRGSSLLFFGFAIAVLVGLGCKKDVASDASDSDANGYLCLKCAAKLYTDRSVFIGPKCPKCQEDTLMEVVGYRCAKDQFLTIRPARGDSRGFTCEKCQASLANAMFLPRAKDLQAWGAVKTSQ